MAAGVEGPDAPVRLVWGDDDYAVQRRARECFEGWTAANPGGDAEVIDGGATNSEEALRVLARLREALQTLPFFGGAKAIWLRQCNFLGEDRVSEGQAVAGSVGDLAKELGAFVWRDVRLLVSAGKVDRRRGFYKTIEKIGQVEHYPGLSADDRDWQDKAEQVAAAEFKTLGKRLTGDALGRFVGFIGPNARLLVVEAQKVAAYVGDAAEVRPADIEAIVSRGRHTRAFAFADAVGDRQLARALRHLDEELWGIRGDRQRSEIGLLYGLIAKFRAMLLAKEVLREGWVRPPTDYRGFSSQLKSLPASRFPSDKRYNPQEISPYMLFRAAQQAGNFTSEELVGAMEELLRCNRRLVGSGLDAGVVLQMAITRIVGNGSQRRSRPAP